MWQGGQGQEGQDGQQQATLSNTLPTPSHPPTALPSLLAPSQVPHPLTRFPPCKPFWAEVEAFDESCSADEMERQEGEGAPAGSLLHGECVPLPLIHTAQHFSHLQMQHKATADAAEAFCQGSPKLCSGFVPKGSATGPSAAEPKVAGSS